MLRPAYLDNDIVLKVCCYSISDETLTGLGHEERPVFILGAARFVVRRRIAIGHDITDPASAACVLEALLTNVGDLEPNDDEIALAAQFEAEAQHQYLELDSGESQLLAMLLTRAAAILLTGDKRAIHAIEQLMLKIGGADHFGRIACLEQLLATLAAICSVQSLRRRICGEPAVDRASSICFSCTSTKFEVESILEGLASYVRDLRAHAPNVLLPSNDLSAVVA